MPSSPKSVKRQDMNRKKKGKRAHPKVATKKAEIVKNDSELVLDTYGGKVIIHWDPKASVTGQGQLAFFAEFLKTTGKLDALIKDCPVKYRSNNASTNREVIGTLLLSILSGHNRYSHVTSIRKDQISADLLGMGKLVSEDTVRRWMLELKEEEGNNWLLKHLKSCTDVLLDKDWILDIDSTVKCIYGKQEGAVKGYNPTKPGRPSLVHHTYFASNLRLVLDVEVQPGNQSSASHAQPGLWSYIDKLPKRKRPTFIRGDNAFGNEHMMLEAENRGVDYLFKLKQTSNVQRLINKVSRQENWSDTDKGWECIESSLCLMGWTKERRVVVLRRKIKEQIVLQNETKTPQAKQLAFIEIAPSTEQYEYAVLVTSLSLPTESFGQLYRDRADAENIFDELKNQWGWGGFVTQDLKRCKISAKLIALIYNWWSLYAGLIFPDKHREAITSRPLLLNSFGRKTNSGGKTILTLSSSHARAKPVQLMLVKTAAFLRKLNDVAEQLTKEQVWGIVLSRSLYRFLHGEFLGPPEMLPIFA